MVSIFMPLTEVRYRFRNQKRIMKCLEVTQTRPKNHIASCFLHPVLYDVINDILIDVSLHPYRYNERESAKAHVDFLPRFPNSIILFDRGYPSEDMFHYLNSKGILFLMRVPKTFKKAISEQEDALFTYPASL